MKKSYILLLCILFFTPISCYGTEILTVDELVEERDKYTGTDVVVAGRFYLDFESNGLYGETHSIWINIDSLPEVFRTSKTLQSFQNKKVLLKAHFGKEKDGHLLGTPGKFVKIYSIELFKK